MHAYLLTGNNKEAIDQMVEKLTQQLHAKKMDFPLNKIDDVRTLNSFTKLRIGTPTTIVCGSIDHATEEALNAFLKNLEEPQENLYYILIAKSIRNLLPTVVSRCQIIKMKGRESKIDAGAANFINLSVGERLAYCSRFKERAEARQFVENLITHWHQDVTTNSQSIEAAILALKRLNANGNVNLQLTNLIISIE